MHYALMCCCVSALRFYRQKLNIVADIEEMETEMQDMAEVQEKEEDTQYTMAKLFRTKALHMPLLVACMLQVVQQLSGINAVCSSFAYLHLCSNLLRHNITLLTKFNIFRYFFTQVEYLKMLE